jgi:hypothetical protein
MSVDELSPLCARGAPLARAVRRARARACRSQRERAHARALMPHPTSARMVENWKPTRNLIINCDCALLSFSRLHMPPPSAPTVRPRKPKTSGSERARRSSFCSIESLRGGPAGAPARAAGAGTSASSGAAAEEEEDSDDDDDDDDIAARSSRRARRCSVSHVAAAASMEFEIESRL